MDNPVPSSMFPTTSVVLTRKATAWAVGYGQVRVQYFTIAQATLYMLGDCDRRAHSSMLPTNQERLDQASCDTWAWDWRHTHLAGHDDPLVVGDVVAPGPQPVAVQGGPQVAAVGEGEQGWPVPRLHQGGVVAVEGLLVL